jgi:hypothetical protein
MVVIVDAECKVAMQKCVAACKLPPASAMQTVVLFVCKVAY